MKKQLYLVLIVLNISLVQSQSYHFDSLIIGKYVGTSYKVNSSDTTQYTICTNDTVTIDESIYPQSNYLHCQTNCWGIAQGDAGIKYYSDTSFARTPVPSCQCFNGKYFGFNDSIRLRFFSLPIWSVFYDFYGRKYWSPVTGWVGIKDHEKVNTSFEIYPNPASAKTSIAFSDGFLPYHLKGRVYDLNGKEVFTFDFPATGSSAVMDVSQLEQGIYFVKVNDYDKMFVKQLVVIR